MRSEAGARGRSRPATTRTLAVALLVAVGLPLLAELGFRATGLHEALSMARRYTALPLVFDEGLPRDPDIVVLGDSRSIHGVRPQVIEASLRAQGLDLSVFNLGLPGAPPIAHLAWVDRLLSRATLPRMALVYLSPYMFSTGIHPVLSREAICSLYTARGAWNALRAGMPLEDVLRALSCSASGLLRHRRHLRAMLEGGALPDRPVAIDIDRGGWVPGGRRRLSEQQRSAQARARAYSKEMARPAAGFNWEQQGYLERTIELLQGAGVEVFLLTSPESSALWSLDREDSTYHEYRERLGETARRHQVSLIDHRQVPVLADIYFADGDHPNPTGATRYSRFLSEELILPQLLGPDWRAHGSLPRPPGGGACRLLFDFEAPAGGEPDQAWSLEGEAFAFGFVGGAVGDQHEVTAFRGAQLLNSYHPDRGDGAEGRATSPPFSIAGGRLRFLVGGGGGEGLAVELVVGDRVLARSFGSDSEALRLHEWDLSEHGAQRARIRVSDRASGPWGHVLVDHVELCQP